MYATHFDDRLWHRTLLNTYVQKLLINTVSYIASCSTYPDHAENVPDSVQLLWPFCQQPRITRKDWAKTMKT